MINKVVCPLCKNSDIEWTGDKRYIDNWFCHGCGRYFHAPMMISVQKFHVRTLSSNGAVK